MVATAHIGIAVAAHNKVVLADRVEAMVGIRTVQACQPPQPGQVVKDQTADWATLIPVMEAVVAVVRER